MIGTLISSTIALILGYIGGMLTGDKLKEKAVTLKDVIVGFFK